MHDQHKRRTSVDELRDAYPDVADAFFALRAAIERSSSLDRKTQELIMLAGYVVARQEGGFKTHAARALAHGASLDDIKTAVLVTLGATAAVEPVGIALRWADEVASNA
jgi:alkylhydroperoxidase/carboxymuconolactone decarboxylase family protein YurZ